MKNDDLISEIAVRTSTRKLIWILFIASILTNTILAFAFVNKKQVIQTVLVPPQIERTMSVSNVEFSKEYLEQMAPYAAHLLLSATPQTVNFQHQLLLGMTSSQYHDALEKELILTQRYLKRNNVATYFTARNAAADINDNSIVLEGTFIATSQGKTIVNTDRKLLIQFENKLGKLQLTSIKEVKDAKAKSNEVEMMSPEASGPTVVSVETTETVTEFKAGEVNNANR